MLLQTLLLVLCINGLFYGVDQATSGEIIIGILSAFIVLFFGVLLVYLARKIGYIEWELRLHSYRELLCKPVATPRGTRAPSPISLRSATPSRRSRRDRSRRSSMSYSANPRKMSRPILTCIDSGSDVGKSQDGKGDGKAVSSTRKVREVRNQHVKGLCAENEDEKINQDGGYDHGM